MNKLDEQYRGLLAEVLYNGIEKEDRTGTGTLSRFGMQIRHDMSQGFPILTTKKVAWKTMVTELKWFLRGDTNIKYLVDNGCNIWNGDTYRNFLKNSVPHDHQETMDEFINKIKKDTLHTNYEFAKKWGELGPIYGKQWRDVNGIDQLENLSTGIISNPHSRRHIVSSWNVNDLDQMTLPPCHYSFQCYVNDGKLYLHLYQRSCDVGLGLPFNTPSYVTLMMIVAQLTDTIPYKFIHSFGDVHIYKNHTSALKEQLCLDTYDMPKLIVDEISDIDRIDVGMFHLYNYKSNKPNKMKMNT